MLPLGTGCINWGRCKCVPVGSVSPGKMSRFSLIAEYDKGFVEGLILGLMKFCRKKRHDFHRLRKSGLCLIVE